MQVRQFHPGMGQAVAERTILRKDAEGKFEDWGDVAHRVSLGNTLLCAEGEDRQAEYNLMKKHMDKVTLLMSGRHLQHGDETQPDRNQEIFTNCSTASLSFMSFLLLMSGSGVGRCFDDDMMLVNYDNAPNILCVLDDEHPDFDYRTHHSVRDAMHKYGRATGYPQFNIPGNKEDWASSHADWSSKVERAGFKNIPVHHEKVIWFDVPDSREGWAKAVEIYETLTFEKSHVGKLLILNFSPVRAKMMPIQGMQGRPASGPSPLMYAFERVASIKGGNMLPWLQTMYVDHYFAECVLVGGARRAARMSVKSWRDKSVIDYINIKRPIEYRGKSFDEILEIRKSSKSMSFLWSSNNSVLVDREFWSLLDLVEGDGGFESDLASHARNVFNALVFAAYADGTGEPGIINVDRLVQNDSGLDLLSPETLVGSEKFQINPGTMDYIRSIFNVAILKQYHMLTNPCVTGDTWIMTSEGPRQVNDLVGVPFTAIVNGKPHESTGFWKTGVKHVYEVCTDRGYSIKATANHKLMISGGEWREIKDLRTSNRLVLTNHGSHSWNGEGSRDLGWIVGEVVGDGGHNPDKYNSYIRFWGEDKVHMESIAIDRLRSIGIEKVSSDLTSKDEGKITISSRELNDIVSVYLSSTGKELLPAIEKTSSDFYRGFLQGFFDANGTVLKSTKRGRSVRLSQSNLGRLYVAQRMLARMGITSTIYRDRREAGIRLLPDGNGGFKKYACKADHELCINKDNMLRFYERIGFADPNKQEALEECLSTLVRKPYRDDFEAAIKSICCVGEKEVFDCSVNDIHAFDGNGIMTHNCGEVNLALWGAYCTIADVVPFFADTIEEAEEAFRIATRSLIRVNTMDSIYKSEVDRTNRIGVGLTGIHEFAWKFFGYNFYDLIDEEKSLNFWMTMSRFSRAVQDEADAYCKVHGKSIPHTLRVSKPSGTVSKLFGLTEGIHLPSMAWYLRWVQFSETDPLIETYRAAGYPTRSLKSYKNTIIVGFPTKLIICDQIPAGKIVYAGQATPEQQYQWLKLLEKYWIECVDEDGKPMEHRGSQLSYTLKYKPSSVSFSAFTKSLREHQSQVRCCSVMPQEDESAYEYLPEEAITKEQYDAIVSVIEAAKKSSKIEVVEDIGKEHLECENGACPIYFNEEK